MLVAMHLCKTRTCQFVIVCSAGNGLFIGNSMPVRDMDMYATWQRQRSNAQAGTSYTPARVHNSSSKPCQGVLDMGVGVAVGSNRGASGIDGVLSTAAGFAASLKRPTTLVVGDVSFLHDINGLNMLRTGQLSLIPTSGSFRSVHQSSIALKCASMGYLQI